MSAASVSSIEKWRLTILVDVQISDEIAFLESFAVDVPNFSTNRSQSSNGNVSRNYRIGNAGKFSVPKMNIGAADLREGSAQ